MILILTSSPTGDLDGKFRVEGIDYRNGFREELRKLWKENTRCLIASATPNDVERNEEFRNFLQDAFAKSNLSCVGVDLLDRRNSGITREEIQTYDMIVLGGGHVPTQNAFFHEIGLKEKLQGFDGIIMGISAGSMNAAELVYAQPEEAGEATDPDYQRFISGLGLTQFNVLPHYQMVKYWYLDGLRIFEDITYPDSEGKPFIALIDGSYIIQNGQEYQVYGPAYWVDPWGLTPVQ